MENFDTEYLVCVNFGNSQRYWRCLALLPPPTRQAFPLSPPPPQAVVPLNHRKVSFFFSTAFLVFLREITGNYVIFQPRETGSQSVCPTRRFFFQENTSLICVFTPLGFCRSFRLDGNPRKLSPDTAAGIANGAQHKQTNG